MAIDHSLTYRVRSLRNFPHRLRLRDIETLVRRLDPPAGAVYADFGCSNGFVTTRVARLIGAAQTLAFDHLPAHLERGRSLHPDITFSPLDLNDRASPVPRCQFVTCFETLEHVGDLDAAVAVLARSLARDGKGLISVPIEIGWRGLVKFLVKVGLYRYDLAELPARPGAWRYLRALLANQRMSRFRDRRAGWGTHFGFDCRDVDEALTRHGIAFCALDRGFTRFYLIGR